MDANQEKKERSFIREHIVPKKRTRRVLLTILATMGLALLFGAISAVSFYTSRVILEQNTPTEASVEAPVVTLPRNDPEAAETGGETPEEPGTEPGTSGQEDATESREAEPQETAVPEVNLKSIFRDVRNGLLRVTITDTIADELFGTPVVKEQTTFAVLIAEAEDYVYAVFDAGLMGPDSELSVSHNNYAVQFAMLGTDVYTGLSVLRVEKASIVTAYTVVPFGNSHTVSAADEIYMIGAQTDAYIAMDTGHITYISGYEDVVDGYRQLIFTNMQRMSGTAAFLLNQRAEIIGWVNDISAGSGNIATAAGVRSLLNIIEDLSSERPTAFIGITGRSLSQQEGERLGLPGGYYIRSVSSDSPAQEAGLRTGDRIISVNETTMQTSYSLQEFIDTLDAGAELTVRIERRNADGWQEMTLLLRTGNRF